MVQLIRLASATNRGGSGNTSFPADFTVNIQNNITITKNASVALKGTSFSTNDANLIQVPANVKIGISGQINTVASFGTLEQGKFSVSQFPSVIFNAILSAMDFKQKVLNNAITPDSVRGFEIMPNIDLLTKRITFNCQMQPNNEKCLNDSTIFPLPATYLTYNEQANYILQTSGAQAQDFIDGKVFMTGNKKLLMGCFQFKVNANYLVIDDVLVNGDSLTFGFISQQTRANTTLTPADYILCVKGKNVAGTYKYEVWYNGASTQTNIEVNQYDIVYFILEKGKIKVYVENRTNNEDNTRNLSVELTQGLSIPYSMNYPNTQNDGYYPVVQFNTDDAIIIPKAENIAGDIEVGGSYYTPTTTQSIDNDGNILDYGPKYIPNEYTIIQASGGSPSGDIELRAGKSLLLDMSQGAFALLNTDVKLIGTISSTSANFEGNGAVRLSLYGDIIVELLDFDLSSYNSNYPDRKSILYVIEKLEEIGTENSTLYSFDVNYPIFLNIFNRDDINVNSFRIRITKDGIPINLTSGATLTLLIDG
jgi:hypothetical protein